MPSEPRLKAVPRSGERRQANKEDKLARIVAAARHIFARKGFEATTVQEIARRARVATGTLFLYADTKRDLAFLAVLQDYEAAMHAAMAVADDPPILDQIMACLTPYLRFYHAQPELSKIVLSEFTFFTTGKHAELQGGRVGMLKRELARRFALAQARAEVVRIGDTAEMAELTYLIFQGVNRAWLRDGGKDLDEGIARLRRMLALALDGLLARPLTAG